ncbi:hypothetical protein AOZ06_14100 [Kibdelosporangium phytohabitans]|uniref:PE domain-containing protein n=2 Tax=Kibdelosporangium phytohabitans TaxID=860235 RepID=A0A0N9HSK9_9PSEU|nr:hypothetical protein AOZ06_14100 [Kibdelosporangium phytohabitans]
MIGSEYNHQSGGGGAGGHYEFTSLAELDTIITELKSVADGIAQDGNKLHRTAEVIAPPAADIMSSLQTEATVTSIDAARLHNQQMLAAAEAEIAKLQAARTAYAQVEDDNTQSFHAGG